MNRLQRQKGGNSALSFPSNDGSLDPHSRSTESKQEAPPVKIYKSGSGGKAETSSVVTTPFLAPVMFEKCGGRVASPSLFPSSLSQDEDFGGLLTPRELKAQEKLLAQHTVLGAPGDGGEV